MSKKEPLHGFAKLALVVLTVCYVAFLLGYESYAPIAFIIVPLIALFSLLDPDGLLTSTFGDIFGAEPRLQRKNIKLKKRHPGKGGPERHPW